MAGEEAILGLLGHGTTGTDGIERGIHLRWQFAPELGFPLGGFQLYRRRSDDGPTPRCADFHAVPVGARPQFLQSKPDGRRLALDAEGTRVEARDPDAPPYRNAPVELRRELDAVDGPLRVMALGREPVRFSLPVPCHETSVLAELGARGHLQLQGTFAKMRVAGAAASAELPTLVRLVLRAPAIDALRVEGHNVAIVRVCHRPVESCADKDAWQLVGDPICLPVYYTGRPCGGTDHPDCDDKEIASRLPENACERTRFDGAARFDLAQSLRILVDPTLAIPPAERQSAGPTVADDCTPPGEAMPTVSLSILDSLLVAALDPAMARILGLYYIDRPDIDQLGRGPFDYKIVGTWSRGSLWQLPESLTFDDTPGARRLVNVFAVGKLIFRSRIRPTIANRPNRSLGTRRALTFIETDSTDWNLPFELPEHGPDLEIVFPHPVGEAQLYVGQDVPNIRLRAYDDGGPVSDWVRSTRRQDILAIHANDAARRITRIVVQGRRFWLHRIAWGPDRIEHGSHCAYVYDLSLRDAARLRAPRDIEAHALPGLVEKAADCQPLRQGATRDGRHRLAIWWHLPDDTRSDEEVPVRYEIFRSDETDAEVPVTTDPVVVGSPFVTGPRYQPLEGWPPEKPLFIDGELEPGTYRYRVRGIDIFGRRSARSEPSGPVRTLAHPPPAPTLVAVRLIDRRDPTLDRADRDALPNGVDAGLRLRWLWSEDAERAAPDAIAFRVYQLPGVPNILEGEVTSLGAGGLAPTIRVANLPEATAELLSGCQLIQGTRRFRIRGHNAGGADGAYQRFVLDLKPPTPPSRAAMRLGPFTIPLATLVPVEVRSTQDLGNGQVRVTLRSTAVRRAPAQGLVRAIVRIRGIGLRIRAVNNENVTPQSVEWICDAEAVTGSVDDLARLLLPVFVPLALRPPRTSRHQDYRTAAAWPDRLGGDLPRATRGVFDLVVRGRQPDEPLGLRQDTDGEYVLVTDGLPADLLATRAAPRKQMTFGVSVVAADGGESAVGAPMSVTHVYRGPLGDPAELAKLSQPARAIGAARIYAGAPNFAGKSSFAFSLRAQAGWSYHIYRCLDETLYAVDKGIRSVTPAVDPATGRFPSAAARDLFIGTYPGPVQAAIRDRIVNPTALDRATIEAHPDADILLQALASLPGNEAAFSRLALPADHFVVAGGDVNVRDDTLDGRAVGRYFYRIRASQGASGPSPLGRSTPPVYVRGTRPLGVPAWIATVGTTAGNVLTWRSTDPRITTLEVLRSGDASSVSTQRGVDQPIPVVAVVDTAPFRVDSSRLLFDPPDGVADISGVYRHGEFDAARIPVANQVATNHLSAWDSVRRILNVSDEIGNGDPVTVVYTNRAGVPRFAASREGVYSWTDAGAAEGTPIFYRIRAQAAGEQASVSNVRAVTRPVALVARTPVVAVLPGGAVRVDWGDAPTVLDVRVQRRELPSGPWSTVGDWQAAADRRIDDDTVSAGQSYAYRSVVRYQGRISLPSSASSPVTVP